MRARKRKEKKGIIITKELQEALGEDGWARTLISHLPVNKIPSPPHRQWPLARPCHPIPSQYEKIKEINRKMGSVVVGRRLLSLDEQPSSSRRRRSHF